MDNIGSYKQTETAGMDEKEMEIRALVKSSAALNQLKENWEERRKELPQVLEKNRRLWVFLASGARDEACPHNLTVRQNIINLANFIFKRTYEVLSHPSPEKLEVLININMQIANGLSGKAE
ncbi:MAG: flagellar biosynthesis regulator FlaF [Alphaproteobacteria bacterium]|nr:flagellar biosynthesis regulator FlaF [Alphaproteobacteria bacterium]MBR1756481.1 flagellar biosynthesis regulator FlaF [Alphaproteobacteria bacterium]